MNIQANNPQSRHVFDLEERTSKFGEAVLRYAKSCLITDLNRSILIQLIRSGTSIGANYMEADGSESKKDFRHIISRCKKEAKETRYWFRMLAIIQPEHKDTLRELWKEAEELTRIFATILKNSQ